MTKPQYLIVAACCLGLSTSGCAVPYVASVRGPIRSVRVLDAETGADVAEATVSLQSQTSMRFLGPPPSTLTCPDLCELQAGASRGVLLRNADRSYHMSGGLGVGSRGFFTGRPEDPNEYPRGVVIVSAHGYRPAMLRYTVGHVEPGWFCTETLDPAEEGKRGQSPFVQSTLRAVPANGDCPLFLDATASFQGGRCELGGDGVLRFHLRPLSKEASAALPLGPARSAASLAKAE
jgi:hypothetical protein